MLFLGWLVGWFNIIIEKDDNDNDERASKRKKGKTAFLEFWLGRR